MRSVFVPGAVKFEPGNSWDHGQTVYVVGLFVVFGVAQSQNPDVWFLAFAISPQFFSFLDTRLAMALGIALFYSAWVSRIIRQSAERADIIDQLEATRAELAAAQHEAGRLAERQRLAADIHDTLAQGFTSIVMLIQAAQADLGGSHPVAGRRLDLAAETVRENLAEARALVAHLAPARLDGSTLPDALRRLSQEPGVDATFDLEGTARPPPMATEVVLLRVCQEALANVRKHAAGLSAAVRLGYDAEAVRLEVSDDGAGFYPERVSGGYGLRGMRTRVDEAGGTLAVCSKPGAGTRVSVMVPV